jgi:hypothetical protein
MMARVRLAGLGASGRSAVAGAVLPEAECGEPDDGLYRDLNDRGAVAWPTGLAPSTLARAWYRGEVAQAVPLALDPMEPGTGLDDYHAERGSVSVISIEIYIDIHGKRSN